MNNLLEDAHKKEKEVRKVKVKTKESRSVMDTDVPIHGSWKTTPKDENDLPFFSVNVNSVARWYRESNTVERLKHIFTTYSIDAAGLQEVCRNWAQ